MSPAAPAVKGLVLLLMGARGAGQQQRPAAAAASSSAAPLLSPNMCQDIKDRYDVDLWRRPSGAIRLPIGAVRTHARQCCHSPTPRHDSKFSIYLL